MKFKFNAVLKITSSFIYKLVPKLCNWLSFYQCQSYYTIVLFTKDRGPIPFNESSSYLCNYGLR